MLTTANKKPRWQGLIQAGLDNGIDLQARGRTNPPAGKSGPFQYVLTSHNRASCIFQVENLKPKLDYLKGGHPGREENLVSFSLHADSLFISSGMMGLNSKSESL
jgi:hypothetical protein